MVAYEVFRSLGIEVVVRPVAVNISKHLDDEDDMKEELRFRDRVGHKFMEPFNTGVKWGQYSDIKDVYEAYPGTMEKVTWTNSPVDENKNVQFIFTIVNSPFPCLLSRMC